MIFKIVSDSSSNLFSLPDVPYETVPMKVITTEKEYVDDGKLDIEAMAEEIYHTKGRSGSSCPNAHEWLSAFEGADRVFAIAITGQLSGSYASALQAAQEYEATHVGAKVLVINSLSAGAELALVIDGLRRQILKHKDFDAICQWVAEYMSHTHTVFSLQSLTNLARNGRVSPALAKVAGIMGIRIVGVASEEGTLQDLYKARGEKKALATIYSEMKARGYGGGRVRISHCLNADAAAALAACIWEEFPGAEVTVDPCGGLCCFYAERGGLIVGYEDCRAKDE